MCRHKQLIEEIAELTKILKKSVINKNIDVVEQTIKEREQLIIEYQLLDDKELSEREKLLVKEMLTTDKEVNVLMEKLVDENRAKIESTRKEKSQLKKRSIVTKRYLSPDLDSSLHSSFNKKT